MERKQADRQHLLTVLIALSLLFSASLVGWNIYEHISAVSFMGQATQQTSRYTMYVGMNDANTNTQRVPTEEMKAKTDAICAKYVDGFAVFRASGHWLDSTGEQVREDTLVYYFYDVSDKQIKVIMDEILVALNQSSILLEKADVNMIFYESTK